MVDPEDGMDTDMFDAVVTTDKGTDAGSEVGAKGGAEVDFVELLSTLPLPWATHLALLTTCLALQQEQRRHHRFRALLKRNKRKKRKHTRVHCRKSRMLPRE